MTTMNVSLPDEMKSFVETQIAREGHASASDYLTSLIREAQRRQAILELNDKLREGLESGPATVMTREDWVAIEREALAGMDGEVIRP
jgi:antitoxin ParD1/3/4